MHELARAQAGAARIVGDVGSQGGVFFGASDEMVEPVGLPETAPPRVV